MKPFKSPALALLLLALAGSALPADEPLHVHVRKVVIDEFPRVRVVFDARSFDKLPFRQLTEENVRLVEEEVQIQDFEIKPYRAGVSIGLVVDDSGSQDPSLGYLKEAAGYLIDRLTQSDEMAVVSFGRLVRPLQRLTNDKRLLKDAVASLKAYGASALYDGVAVGMHESADGIGRQVVVVISDGNERNFPYNGKRLSRDTLPHLIAAARHHGINVYTIGVGRGVDHGLLETLALETGGRYLAAPKRDSLKSLFDTLLQSFETSYQVIYHSPNLKEETLVRGGVVKLRFLGHSGAAPFRYSVRPKTELNRLSVSRTAVWKDKNGRLRVYTRGLRDNFVPMRFTLKDSGGRIVRQGLTTRDGYGAPLEGGMPEMLELPPGSYALDLGEPDTDLVFHHPRITLRKGQSTDLTFNFARLMFRRNGTFWYDTEHALGETSDLVNLSIVDMASGKTLRSGPLSTFKHRRDASLWLESGAYRVRLDNHIGSSSPQGRGAARGGRPPVAPSGVEPAVLRNALTAELEAKGGEVLFFDVAYDDFLLEQDPRLIPDELPENPRAGEEPPMNERLSMLGHAPFMTHADALRDSLEGEVEEKLAPAKVSRSALRRARRSNPSGTGTGKGIGEAKPKPAAADPGTPAPEAAPNPPAEPAPASPVPDSAPAAKGPKRAAAEPAAEIDELAISDLAAPPLPQAEAPIARPLPSVASLTVVPGHADPAGPPRPPEAPAPVRQAEPVPQPEAAQPAAIEGATLPIHPEVGARALPSIHPVPQPPTDAPSVASSVAPEPAGRRPTSQTSEADMESLLESGGSAPAPQQALSPVTPAAAATPSRAGKVREKLASRRRSRQRQDKLVSIEPETLDASSLRPASKAAAEAKSMPAADRPAPRKTDESDGSVYVTPKRAEHDAAVEAAEVAKAAEALAAVKSSPAEVVPALPATAAAPSLPPAEDAVIAKLKRMRAQARSPRTASAPDSVSRLEQLAGTTTKQ